MRKPISVLDNLLLWKIEFHTEYLFGRDTVKGLEDLGIPNEIENNVMIEYEMNI